MAALASGIFNHAITAGQALSASSPVPMASQATGTSGTSSTSSTDSSTISANDFLTLLVTEMKNQDPTANTDPNEYINQLVNVNSLEQLININQTLSTALGSPSATQGSSGSSQSMASPESSVGSTTVGASAQTGTAAPRGGVLTSAQTSSAGPAAAGDLSALSSALKRAPGNLSVPAVLPAAQSVAHALNGRSRAHAKVAD